MYPNDLEHLLALSRRMVETHALQPLLDYAMDEAIRLVGAERGYIVLLNEDGSLDFRVTQGASSDEPGIGEDQISTSILRNVIQTGQPQVIRNAMADPRWKQSKSVFLLQLRSVICVPLVSDERSIGAIYVENRSIENRFDKDDLETLMLFANQASVSIANARLYSDLEHQVQERTQELYQEIERRKRTEAQLQDYQRQLEAQNLELRQRSLAIEQSGSAVVITDTDGTILYVNPRAEETSGYTRSEAVGQNARLLKSNEHDADFYRILWATITSGRIWHGAFHNRRKDGSLYWEAATIAPVYHSTGKITNYIAIKEDITAQKQMQEALHLNSMRQAALLKLYETVSSTPERELVESALELGLQVTLSSIGYVYFVESDQVDLRLITWSKNTYKQCNVESNPKYSIEEAGIWADCLRLRQPVIHNDYQNTPNRKGYPEGHIHIQRHLGVPLFENDRAVAIIGVGNKADPYNDTDVRQLSLLLSNVWILLQRRRAEKALIQANSELGRRVADRTADLQAANERLVQEIAVRKGAEAAAVEQRLLAQALSAQLISAQEEERKKIAQQLHDEAGQNLTAIAIDLAKFEKTLPPDIRDKMELSLGETRTLADQTLALIRALALDLRPSILDDLGLSAALRWYVGRFRQRTNIEMQIKEVDLPDRLAPQLEITLYRVIQEALTNIARHAQASQASVRLEVQQAMLRCVIDDNGIGFDAKAAATRHLPSLGLAGIRERVFAWGGTFTIDSEPGQGTRLTIEIPLIDHH